MRYKVFCTILIAWVYSRAAKRTRLCIETGDKVKLILKFNIANTEYNIPIGREMCYIMFSIRVITFGVGGVNDI